MKIQILKNNCEGNISKPAKPGDVGYDVKSQNITVKGRRARYRLYNSTGSWKVEPVELPLEEALEERWAAIDFIEYDTGIAIAPEDESFYAEALPNSRNTKMNLALGNSVGQIDPPYRGTIRFRYSYSFQPEDLVINDGWILGLINVEKIYGRGEVCGQIVFKHTVYPELEYVDELPETERGDGGFGSTEKKS